MSTWQIPLADVELSQSDLDAVVETYRSGWLSMGPRTKEFEERFAAYVGGRHAIAVSSGTAALHLMTVAAGLGPDDEVVLPSLTFVATANSVRYAGARTVFADIAALDDPVMSAAAARASLSSRTRAILHVPYGGTPSQLRALRELADEHGLRLYLDAAHAVGSTLDGRPVSTVAHASAFSFFSNKNLAIGEGGMVVTDDDEFARRVRLLRSHGMTTLTWDRHRGHASGYDVIALGFNYRLDEPRAALGASRLARLDEDNARRAQCDARYRALLDGVVECAMPPVADGRSAYHLFTIVLDEGVDRDEFRTVLAADGVQTSVHYPPVHRFAIHESDGAALTLTEAYARRSVTLPLYAHLREDQQEHVAGAVRRALAR